MKIVTAEHELQHPEGIPHINHGTHIEQRKKQRGHISKHIAEAQRQFADASTFDGQEPANSFYGDIEAPDNATGNVVLDKLLTSNSKWLRNAAIKGVQKKTDQLNNAANMVAAYQNAQTNAANAAGQYVANQQQQQAVVDPNAALQTIQQNLPLVQGYVQQYGPQYGQSVPYQNPAQLAMQAGTIYGQQVEDKMFYVPDQDLAEQSVWADVSEDWGSENADEFFGSLLQSIVNAGKTLIDKINEKRAAKGKRPLFAGKGWQKIAEKYAANKDVVDEALTSAERAFLAVTRNEYAQKSGGGFSATPVGAAGNAFINDQKKQAIMQYLPYAILLIVVVFFIGKKMG